MIQYLYKKSKFLIALNCVILTKNNINYIENNISTILNFFPYDIKIRYLSTKTSINNKHTDI